MAGHIAYVLIGKQPNTQLQRQLPYLYPLGSAPFYATPALGAGLVAEACGVWAASVDASRPSLEAQVLNLEWLNVQVGLLVLTALGSAGSQGQWLRVWEAFEELRRELQRV